jgi:hypothetical protein
MEALVLNHGLGADSWLSASKCPMSRDGVSRQAASVSRSLDLTGSDWGLRKKTHREIWGRESPALLMRDAGDPLHLQVHLFIQQVLESR